MEQQQDDGEEETMRQDPIVTSGESDEGVLDSDIDEEDKGGRHLLLHPPRHDKTTGDALLYDENADNEDEAYVYNCLRGGAAETSTVAESVAKMSSSSDKSKQIAKPRNSDAVLSCPCCLSIVCMDCQQHERYANQYRAMFVMNIMVQWDVRLRFDNVQGHLVPCEATTKDTWKNAPRVVEDHGEEDEEEKQKHKEESEVIFYKVCCANCFTQVASLDMTDEVYHFYGCVASA